MRSFADTAFARRLLVFVLCGGVWAGLPAAARAQSAEQMYARALARERTLLDADLHPTLKQIRLAAAAYLRIPARFPRSGYSDNALWQASGLYALAFERFHEESDRRNAQRTLNRLRAAYPSSSLIARAREITRRLTAQPAPPTVARAAQRDAVTAGAPTPASAPPRAVPAVAPTAPSAPPPVARTAANASAPAIKAAAAPAPLPVVSTLVGINRAELGDVVRVTLELDSEIAYHQERIDSPPRVFFDLKGVRLGPRLTEAAINFGSGVVRQVRVGRREENTTRVAMDLDGVRRYTVFTLYDPYRLVIDFERDRIATAAATAGSVESIPPAAAVPETTVPSPSPDVPLPSSPTVPVMTAPPSVPAANRTGGYSMARQLGLGVARVVIDPGHGGHDPGARAHRVAEAELVLDIARRLEKLLLKERGMDVVMTRRTDVFVPLEERTAIANRAGADLFLSIHANASERPSARGVETYYLNFASNPEAEAVAARENSASSRTLHALPDILRAIALNDKLDESRDFAEMVQRAMVVRLRPQNGDLKSLGVKRAPFVVLIGAGMPSVLAEISFVTNRQEAALLRTGSYRQRIAQALFDAIVQYQRSLKNVTAVADSSGR
ncbi:MAG TPA: N-acetylmuramoyl-L-alanine amidase [Vicinamibacterales bacterium]|nr:N-acetylmuramoyl-L-alanine amidase [Vicinamibacterales bacterium]